MAYNFLHLNASKTVAIVFGPMVGKVKSASNLGDLFSSIKPTVKSLRVTLDSALKFDKHTNKVVKSIFFHLKLLARVKPFLSSKDMERVTPAFV